MPPYVDFILHVDDHLKTAIAQHGQWIYGILFAIIFMETGFVIMPFLPGDSLLFAVGMFSNSSKDGLSYPLVFALLSSAAFLGDNLNYQVGKRLGPAMFRNENSKFFKRSYLDKTHAFFEKYGGWALVVARFVPIVRTFAPFVAGMGTMTFPRFLMYSSMGALFWVGTCVTAGYFFGQIPWVQANFEKVIVGIVVLSIIPMAYKMWKAKKAA